MADSNREEIAKLEALYANNPGGRIFTHLAEAYRKAGELDRARSILESGITRHADYASAHVVLGRVMFDQGALESAATEFRRVLELDPENRVALRSLGDIARSSDPKYALEHYRHLKSLDPADDELANTITTLEAQLEDAPMGETLTESVEEVVLESAYGMIQPPAEASPVFPAEAEGDAVAQAEPDPVETHPSEPFELPIEPITADYGVDWRDDAAEQDGLPGDLAHLTRADESQAETQSPVFVPVAPAEPSSEPMLAHEPPQFEAAAEEREVERAKEEAQRQAAWSESDRMVDNAWPKQHQPEAVHTDAIQLDELELVASTPEPVKSEEPQPAEIQLIGSQPEAEQEPPHAAPWEEPQEATLEVTGFDAAAEETLDAESMTESGAPEPESGSGALPEFPGFSEAADAAFRAEGEVDFEAPEPSITQEPTFEEMLSASLGAESPLVSPDGEDLPTETLAELYRTQGFFGRAADVYRALLVVTPDDVRLRELLTEVELLEHSPNLDAGGERILELDSVPVEDVELSARLAASAEDAGPPEAWLETIESAWTGGDGAVDIDDSQYPWSHDAREEEIGGPTLQDYLRTLLAWHPTELPAAPLEEAPEPQEEEPSETFAYSVPGGTEPPPAQTAPTERWTAPEPLDPWEGIPASYPVPQPETPAPVAAPSQLSASPVSASQSHPPTSHSARSSGSSVDDAFEEWFGGGQPADSTRAAAVPTPPGGSQAAAPPASAADVEEEPDDDLEVFRSWLQSLKR